VPLLYLAISDLAWCTMHLLRPTLRPPANSTKGPCHVVMIDSEETPTLATPCGGQHPDAVMVLVHLQW